MNQLTIGQIFHAVWRHKFKSLLAFAFVMAIVLAGFVIWPRQYGSEGRLYVQLGRNNTGMDPTTSTKSVSIQDTRETKIRTVVEIAKSRAVIDEVVDEVGAEEILEPSVLSRYISLPSFSSLIQPTSEKSGDGMSAEEYQRLRKREKAAKELGSNLTVTAEKKTSVISIYVKASSPKLAQRIVDSLIRHTQEKHLDIHSQAGSSKFFDEEYAKHSELLDSAILAQTEFRSKLGVLSIDGARSTWQGILDRLQNEEISAALELTQATERVKKFEQELAEVESTVAVPTEGVERKSFEDARTEVMRLKTERARLAATRSEENYLIVQLDEAIRNAESALQKMTGEDRRESQIQMNPVYESVMTSLVGARVSRDVADARLKSIQLKLDEANEQLAELNDSLLEADRKQRQVELAKQYLGNYASKRGEARVLDQLDRQRISDVVVAQDANLILKHVSPRGSLVALMGLVLASLTAICTGMFFDRNNLSAPFGEEEVEEILGLPVLVTLPRVYSARNMVN